MYCEVADTSEIRYHDESDGCIPMTRCEWPLSGKYPAAHGGDDDDDDYLTFILYESVWTVFIMTLQLYILY